MNHIELGKEGERRAVNFLSSIGYKVIEVNYKWKQSEVDIICLDGNEVVIVEVKTRNSLALGEPYESVTRAKQKQIIKVTNEFIQSRNLNNDIRFDVVSIILNKNQMNLDHIKNAFYPIV